MTEIPMIAGYDPGTSQWRGKRLQMINWGGFHGGPHVVRFGPEATLLSGPSGSGKSTLLDAYTALMMPSNTAFNGASNDVAQGRSRGDGKRTLLSYIRGQKDEGDAITGTEASVLRGDGVPTWSALAMTFVDDRAHPFTVLKSFFAPASARIVTDITEKRFTISTELDLGILEGFAQTQFPVKAMKQELLGLMSYDTQSGFIDAVTSKLGIGANGGPERPLRLLARIQAGHQVATVDKLYKEMVLEKPVTLRKADSAWAQFHNLERSYRDLETDRRKKEVLDGIDEIHDRMVEAERAAERLDRFGVASPLSNTPFAWWRAQELAQVLDDAEVSTREEKSAAEDRLAAATLASNKARDEWAELVAAVAREGGDRLDQLKRRRDQLEIDVRRAVEACVQLDKKTRVLDLSWDSAEEFVQLQRTVPGGVDRAEAERATADAHREDLIVRRHELEQQIVDLRAEADSLQRRRGQVPRELDETRREIARACRMEPEELPFLAELIDVSPDEAEWRLAAEMSLRGTALTMLINIDQEQEIRATINPLALIRRIQFIGAEHDLPLLSDLDPSMISGKLIFREDSPFAGWAMRRVADPDIDHLCVEDPRELGGKQPKVTKQGQTSRGARGAHGRDPNQRFILGFDNTSRQKDLADEFQQTTADLQQISNDMEAQKSIGEISRRKIEAYRALGETRWVDIDVASPAHELDTVKAELTELSERSDVLRTLQQQAQEARDRFDQANLALGSAGSAVEDTKKRYGLIVDRKDGAVNEMMRLERFGIAPLAEDDISYLAQELQRVPGDLDYATFDSHLDQLKRDLTRESSQLGKEADGARRELVAAFTRYNDLWRDDPDRGTTAIEFPAFKAIHDDIARHRLFEQRDHFKKKFQEWSGQDLTILKDAYRESHREIEARLEPVNAILRGLSFGPEDDRLQIQVRRTDTADVVDFTRRLGELAKNTAIEWTEDQLEERFTKLRELMQLIRPDNPQRDELLDVRRHIDVTAVRQGVDGTEKARYSSLGGKSGGESQELAAFIVGAALRYQLGDDTRTRPRFAPIFLDEGFVKADGNFAGRAVQAWRGLGFQLIVCGPTDKVTSLEPHMSTLYAIVKDQRTGYSFVTPFTKPEKAS